MKQNHMKVLALTVGLCMVDATGWAETILAGWSKPGYVRDKNSGKPDVVATGISAKVIWSDDGTPGSHWGASRENGSADGTFGMKISGAAINNGTYMTSVEGAYMDFTITNTGEESVELETFCFDAWRATGDGYQVSVISGDLITEIASGKFTAQRSAPPENSDFEDIDISIAGLAEHTLRPGQSMVFRLKTLNRKGGGNLFVDNIAICGTRVH